MTEPVEAGLPLRRGFIRVGGKPIVQHQLNTVLAFGCDRIVCLAKSLDPEVIALQHAAEAEGKLFHSISSPQQLSGLVTANDELIVMSEGLLAQPERARSLLETGPGVFVQPVEAGLAAGFERLDINHASAGLLRIPGRLVETLVQMPPDCDVPSALTRIALQAGVPMREIPTEARTGMRWQMIASESDAYAIEHDWLAEQIGNPRNVSPGRWIARQGVLGFGSSLLHAGNASMLLSVAMAGAMVIALGFAWIGLLAAGFAACGLAWVFQRAALLLRRIELPQAQRDGDGMPHLVLMEWLLDAEIVLLIIWASDALPGENILLRAFAPLIFILLIRHAAQLRQMVGAAWLGDRMVLSLLLSLIAIVGGMAWFVRAAALALAITAIAISRAEKG